MRVIVQDDKEAMPEQNLPDLMADRRPVVVFPKYDVAVVGRGGSHHPEVIDYARWEGIISPDRGMEGRHVYGEIRTETRIFQWFEIGDSLELINPSEVEKEVIDALGLGGNTDDFKFGASSPPQINVFLVPTDKKYYELNGEHGTGDYPLIIQSIGDQVDEYDFVPERINVWVGPENSYHYDMVMAATDAGMKPEFNQDFDYQISNQERDLDVRAEFFGEDPEPWRGKKAYLTMARLNEQTGLVSAGYGGFDSETPLTDEEDAMIADAVWQQLGQRDEFKFGASDFKVVYGNYDNDHPGLRDRAPLIYDFTENVLYVGNPGNYHQHLFEEFPHLREYFLSGRDQIAYGQINRWNEPEWFSREAAPEDVQAYVGKLKINWPPEIPDEDDQLEFKFGARGDNIEIIDLTKEENLYGRHDPDHTPDYTPEWPIIVVPLGHRWEGDLEYKVFVGRENGFHAEIQENPIFQQVAERMDEGSVLAQARYGEGEQLFLEGDVDEDVRSAIEDKLDAFLGFDPTQFKFGSNNRVIVDLTNTEDNYGPHDFEGEFGNGVSYPVLVTEGAIYVGRGDGYHAEILEEPEVSKDWMAGRLGNPIAMRFSPDSGKIVDMPSVAYGQESPIDEQDAEQIAQQLREFFGGEPKDGFKFGAIPVEDRPIFADQLKMWVESFPAEDHAHEKNLSLEKASSWFRRRLNNFLRQADVIVDPEDQEKISEDQAQCTECGFAHKPGTCPKSKGGPMIMPPEPESSALGEENFSFDDGDQKTSSEGLLPVWVDEDSRVVGSGKEKFAIAQGDGEFDGHSMYVLPSLGQIWVGTSSYVHHFQIKRALNDAGINDPAYPMWTMFDRLVIDSPDDNPEIAPLVQSELLALAPTISDALGLPPLPPRQYADGEILTYEDTSDPGVLEESDFKFGSNQMPIEIYDVGDGSNHNGGDRWPFIVRKLETGEIRVFVGDFGSFHDDIRDLLRLQNHPKMYTKPRRPDGGYYDWEVYVGNEGVDGVVDSYGTFEWYGDNILEERPAIEEAIRGFVGAPSPDDDFKFGSIVDRVKNYFGIGQGVWRRQSSDEVVVHDLRNLPEGQYPSHQDYVGENFPYLRPDDTLNRQYPVIAWEQDDVWHIALGRDDGFHSEMQDDVEQFFGMSYGEAYDRMQVPPADGRFSPPDDLVFHSHYGVPNWAVARMVAALRDYFPEESSFKFGSENIQVIVQDEAMPGWEKNFEFSDIRRPVLFYPEHNTVAVGRPGGFHNELEEFMAPMEPELDSNYAGWIDDGDDQVVWFGTPGHKLMWEEGSTSDVTGEPFDVLQFDKAAVNNSIVAALSNGSDFKFGYNEEDNPQEEGPAMPSIAVEVLPPGELFQKALERNPDLAHNTGDHPVVIYQNRNTREIKCWVGPHDGFHQDMADRIPGYNEEGGRPYVSRDWREQGWWVVNDRWNENWGFAGGAGMRNSPADQVKNPNGAAYGILADEELTELDSKIRSALGVQKAGDDFRFGNVIAMPSGSVAPSARLPDNAA